MRVPGQTKPPNFVPVLTFRIDLKVLTKIEEGGEL